MSPPSGPEDPATVIRQLHELRQRRRLGPMRALVRRTLPSHPDHPQLLFYAAWLDYCEGRHDDAQATCQRLLELDPHSPGARALLADIYQTLDDVARAEAVYRSLLADFPDDAHYLACYALLLAGTVHLNRAAELAAKAIALEPDNPVALRASVFVSLLRGDERVTDERLQALLARDPQAEATLASLADVLRDRGRYRQALQVAQELLRLAPDSARTVDVVIELRHKAHWTMAPLRPFLRLGKEGLAALAVVAIGVLQMSESATVRAGSLAALAFAAYGAVWPALLKALLKR